MGYMNDDIRHALALADTDSDAIGRVGIIGASALGADIAMDLLDVDVPVTLFDPARASLDELIALTRSAYRDALERAGLTQEQHDRRLALLACTTHFHHLKDCDLIVDIGHADMASKKALFRGLDQVAKPTATLMTANPKASVDHIAACTRYPANVLGVKVLDSASKRGVWELVPGSGTSSETLCTMIALGRKLHKVAVIPDTGDDEAAGQNATAVDVS